MLEKYLTISRFDASPFYAELLTLIKLAAVILPVNGFDDLAKA